MDTSLRKRLGTRAIAAVLLGLCAVLYYRTFSFPEPLGIFGSDYGSAFFPRIMLGVVGGCSLLLLVQSFLPRPTGSGEEVEGLALGRRQVGRVAAVWLGCVLFCWLWVTVGYLYASPVFVLGVSLLLGIRNLLLLLVLGALGPLLSLFFWNFLRVSL